LVAGGLVDALLDGDATSVERIAARFTGMVFPGDDLETVARRADGGGYRFETTRPGGSVVMEGTIRRRGF
jgi:acyl dehydratase